MSLDFLLKSFKEEDKADKGEVSLTGILQRKRLKLGRLKGPRVASMYFNPYALAYGFCMREKVAQLAGYHQIMVKPPTPKEQLIFDIGHKYHDILQGYFWKLDMLEGMWRCRSGGCDLEWWDRSPIECPYCHSKEYLEYREVPLVNKKYQIRGRADGVLFVEQNNTVERHLVDIKSMSNRGYNDSDLNPRVYFEDLDKQGALLTHRVQLSTYMFLSGIHNGHLLYVAKNGHQIKSFHLTYNEELLRPYLDTILEALAWAKELKEGARSDLPAPCDRKKCECERIIRTNERR